MTPPLLDARPLPDLLALPSGGRAASAAAWAPLAEGWRTFAIETVYGALPPAPEAMEVEFLCQSVLRRWPGEPRLASYRLHCRGGARPVTLGVRLLTPAGEGPFPVLIEGDGCWWYADEAMLRRCLAAGLAVALLNRTELAPDPPPAEAAPFLPGGERPEPALRRGGLFDAYPGRDFGAIAAWAWGLHRCVDLLTCLPIADPTRLAVSGHSRGGKAALLAGASDPRIALVNDNAGGTCGAAAFRWLGQGGEALEAILDRFPTWFSRGLGAWRGRVRELQVDQHALLAAVAPRSLLLTYALDDRWSNPEGMVLAARAAAEVYALLGRRNALAFHLRAGTHSHAPEDWEVLLDFIAWQWRGAEPRSAFGRHPFDHLDR